MSMLEQKQLKAHRDSVHRDCQFMAAKSKVDISLDKLIQKSFSYSSMVPHGLDNT